MLILTDDAVIAPVVDTDEKSKQAVDQAVRRGQGRFEDLGSNL